MHIRWVGAAKACAAAFAAVMVVPAACEDVSGTVQRRGRAAAYSVVYLVGDRKSVPGLKATVDQRDKTFSPHVSVVTVGTTVHFPNNDTVFHNVYAYFDAKKFDLGMYPRGADKTVKFDKPGVVAVLCNVHSDMSAYIMVVDTPFYAVADKSGSFKIHNVPLGSYTLRAWHESGAMFSTTLNVSDNTPPITVSLGRK